MTLQTAERGQRILSVQMGPRRTMRHEGGSTTNTPALILPKGAPARQLLQSYTSPVTLEGCMQAPARHCETKDPFAKPGNADPRNRPPADKYKQNLVKSAAADTVLRARYERREC